MIEENDEIRQKLNALGKRVRRGLGAQHPLDEKNALKIQQTILEGYINRLGDKVEKLEKLLGDKTEPKTPSAGLSEKHTPHEKESH